MYSVFLIVIVIAIVNQFWKSKLMSSSSPYRNAALRLTKRRRFTYHGGLGDNEAQTLLMEMSTEDNFVGLKVETCSVEGLNLHRFLLRTNLETNLKELTIRRVTDTNKLHLLGKAIQYHPVLDMLKLVSFTPKNDPKATAVLALHATKVRRLIFYYHYIPPKLLFYLGRCFLRDREKEGRKAEEITAFCYDKEVDFEEERMAGIKSLLCFGAKTELALIHLRRVVPFPVGQITYLAELSRSLRIDFNFQA